MFNLADLTNLRVLPSSFWSFETPFDDHVFKGEKEHLYWKVKQRIHKQHAFIL